MLANLNLRVNSTSAVPMMRAKQNTPSMNESQPLRNVNAKAKAKTQKLDFKA